MTDPASDLDTIIRRHVAAVGAPFGRGRQVSMALADDLIAHGRDASVIRCSGYGGHAPQADPRWHALGSPYWWVHYLVRVDDTVYDLTRRQFYPDAPDVFKQSTQELRESWEEVDVDRRWLKARDVDSLPRPTM